MNRPKSVIVLLMLLMLAGSFCIGESIALIPSEGKVIAEGAALRQSPTKAQPAILSLKFGDALTVNEVISNDEGNWFAVVLERGSREYEGYVLSLYVSAELIDADGNQINLPAKLRVRAEAVAVGGYNHVGHNWTREFWLNGETLANYAEYTFSAGDELRLSAEIIENDSSPDISHIDETHTLTQSELDAGFSLTYQVYVTENRGRYSGNSCLWQVTFYFMKA